MDTSEATSQASSTEKEKVHPETRMSNEGTLFETSKEGHETWDVGERPADEAAVAAAPSAPASASPRSVHGISVSFLRGEMGAGSRGIEHI